MRPVVGAGGEPEVGDAVEFARVRLGFEADAKQAVVLRSEAKRGILNCSRQWGKSTVAVLVASPTERQSGEFLKKTEGMLEMLRIPARGDGHNALSLVLPNGSRIVGLPGTGATVRGFSAVSLLVIEEAAYVDDSMYKALRPMLAVGGGDLWMMSTPRGKRGFFYETWTLGGPEWEKVQAPATECARIPSAFLDEEREAQGLRWFQQEYMTEFIDNGDQAFDRDLIEAAVTDECAAFDFPRKSTKW
jgi:hypothetical protein